MTLRSLKNLTFQNRHAIALLAIVALGTFLRIHNLGEKSLWQDEALFWQWADGLTIDDFFQGKHYSLNIYVILISGINRLSIDESVLRLLSALSGIATIPALYYLARRITSKESALASALFLSIAPNQVSQSQQLREYSLTVLLTLLIIIFFFRYMNNEHGTDLTLFSFFSIVGIYTQVGLLIILASLGLASLLLVLTDVDYRSKRPLIGLGIYALLISLAGLFLWQFAYAQFIGFAADGYLTQGYWKRNLSSLVPFIWDNSWLTVKYAFNSKTDLFAMFFLIWGVGKLIKGFPNSRFISGLVLFPIAISILAGLTHVYPYAGSRHTIFLSVPIYLLVSLGANELLKYRSWLFGLAVGLIGFYLLLSSTSLVSGEGHEEMRSVSETLCNNLGPNDHIYIQSEAIPAFDYYWQKCQLSKNEIHWRFLPEQLNTGNFYTGQFFLEANSTSGNLWFVTSHLNEGELNRFLHSVAQDLGQRPAKFFEAPGAELFWLKSN